MWSCVSAEHDLCGYSAMNGVMTTAHDISDIDRAGSVAAVQDTVAMIVGSGSSVATGQRAAEHMARPRMSLASPHTVERSHIVTAHILGRTTSNVIRTDFKVPRKCFPPNVRH
jgi:hypothetical protein